MTTNSIHLADFLRERYTDEDIDRLTSMLTAQGTFVFPRMANGLFRAAATEGAEGDVTGYANVWVRDNIYIAHAHWVLGQPQIAVANVRALMRYFTRYRNRLDDVIAGRADYADPMQRPHIRFKGDDLSELTQKWAHAQNDALGYFLWLFSCLALEGELQASREDIELLMTLVRYFERIEFWHDEDSGHWEEARKVSASSIGVATAGLTEFAELLAERCESSSDDAASDDAAELETWAKHAITLADRGRRAMNAILPAECAQGDPAKHRRYDAALLFLIWPMEIVGREMADRILTDVREHLQGEHGIRRYLGDSYWCNDYKTSLGDAERTADFSDDMASRDRLLKPGLEAQWCIFDPVVSVIYGGRYRESRDPVDLRLQTHYLNRSLAQLTGSDIGKSGAATDDGRFPPFRCPESNYYERGRYVPNDITPLLWTQANLAVALVTMRQSVQ